MNHNMVLVERDVLQHELETVFDGQTTEALLRVLEKVASQVYAATVPRADFSGLKRLVEQIAGQLAQLTEQVQQLLEAQRRNEERFSRIEADISELKTDVVVLKTDVGHLKGDSLERKYRDKAPAYFGRLIRKPKVVDLNRLWDDLEKHLSQSELEDVLLVDLIVKGRPKDRTISGDLYLAVEISTVVDRNDIERARRRAALLQKAGFDAIPVAAGLETTAGAEQEARSQQVALLSNGGVSLWEEAFSSRIPSTSP